MVTPEVLGAGQRCDHAGTHRGLLRWKFEDDLFSNPGGADTGAAVHSHILYVSQTILCISKILKKKFQFVTASQSWTYMISMFSERQGETTCLTFQKGQGFWQGQFIFWLKPH